MKIKKKISSLIMMLVMALALTATVPALLPQTHTVYAAKKKAAKKKKPAKKGKKTKASKKGKKSKKEPVLNLKLDKSIVKTYVGKKTKLTLKGAKKQKVAWTVSGGAVKLNKKTGSKVTFTAVKNGTSVVTAKVGKKNKIKAIVFVGDGAYAKASKKVKKAAGRPIELVARKLAGHPIVLSTGNTNTTGNPDKQSETYVTTYKLEVQGGNLVVSVLQNWNEIYKVDTNGDGVDEPTNEATTRGYSLSLPIAGGLTAHYEYTYADDYYYSKYNERTEADIPNINQVTVASRFDVLESESSTSKLDPSNVSNSSEVKKNQATFVGGCINVLDGILRENNFGFTARDLGFTSFHANAYSGSAGLNARDLAEYAIQNRQFKQYNIANYNKDDYDEG